MIQKIVAAEVGRRIAGRHNGLKGALLGAAAPWLARRAFTPAGLAVAGLYAAKRLYDRKRDGDRQSVNAAASARPR